MRKFIKIIKNIRKFLKTFNIGRQKEGRIFAGICTSVAKIFSVNVWYVRLVFIGFTIFTLGLFALVYLFVALVVPSSEKRKVHKINDDYIDVEAREKK